uniref:Uncharacterized protein n=1 Tax=Steinernema glaseri TaxID=37863 RepID=A0A1I7ZS61_9BILA
MLDVTMQPYDVNSPSSSANYMSAELINRICMNRQERNLILEFCTGFGDMLKSISPPRPLRHCSQRDYKNY